MLEYDSEEYWEKINQDFPALSIEMDGTAVTYLDSAATSLKPASIVEAMNSYYLGISSNVHRGKHFALEETSNRFEQARYKIANFIGCSGNEVVFVRNTTEAVNMVATGIKLGNDDFVLAMSDAHHSNILPWSSRFKTEYVNTDSNGALDLTHYQEMLDKKPSLVALTHCSNVTGIYIPIEDMVKMAKQAGCLVLVDGAQSVPHRKVDVKALDVDFLCFSGHKMLGPTGIGVLYGKSELLEALEPSEFGGGMVDWVELDHFRLRKIPHRLEAGTPHIAGAMGLGAAIDYLNSLGMENVEKHDVALGQLLLSEASKRPYMKVVYPSQDADRGGIISLSFPALKDLGDVARYLSDSYGIMCRNGHLCAQPYINKESAGEVLRVSAYLYTREKDIQHFFSAIDEIAAFLMPDAVKQSV